MASPGTAALRQLPLEEKKGPAWLQGSSTGSSAVCRGFRQVGFPLDFARGRLAEAEPLPHPSLV